MLYPSITDLMEKAGSRYSLVIAASKRARQISEDALNHDRSIDGAKSISEAVVDIAEGKVEIVNHEIYVKENKETEDGNDMGSDEIVEE